MLRKSLPWLAALLLLVAFAAVPDQSTTDQTTHYLIKK